MAQNARPGAWPTHRASGMSSFDADDNRENKPNSNGAQENWRAIHELARKFGRPIASLLALAPQNDPFYLGEARLRDAEWFAELYSEHEFGFGIHLRRIHYRLISQEMPIRLRDGSDYLNTVECWQKLCTAASAARYAQLVPLDHFVDQRNPECEVYLPDSVIGEPRKFVVRDKLEVEIPETVPAPYLALFGDRLQPYHVEIWCEKSTVNDVLFPLARQYGLNVQTSVGEISLTRCRELVERAKRNGGRPVRIIYLSDFDPAGQSMPVAAARKLEWLADNNCDVQLQPIALTHNQCVEYALPRTPIKETELRAARFEARFGEGATELDALEALHPGALEDILVAEIERFYDPDFPVAWQRTQSEAQARLDEITTEVLSRHGEDADLEERLAALREAAGELALDIEERNDIIEGELEEAARGVEFDWPEPREADEWDNPLFDGIRDYLDQIDSYKAFQGKPTRRRKRRRQ
jgi:hypothetical protein